MNDPVRVDKASLDALTESLRAQSVKLAQAEARIAEQNTEIAALRALLIHHGLETADEATEPEGDRETRETQPFHAMRAAVNGALASRGTRHVQTTQAGRIHGYRFARRVGIP